MDEEAIKDKLKKAKIAEEQQEQERMRIKSDMIKKRERLENEIKSELEEWEAEFPKEPEIIDEKPFVTARNGLYLYLFKKKGDIKTYVLIKSGNTIKEIQDVAYFMETFAASDQVLELLKKRIPAFVEYLSTKVES